MVTTSVINIDLIANTATNIFTLNNIVLNNITLSNNQITFNTRASGSLSIADLSLNIAQLLLFQQSLELNFPSLIPLYRSSIGICNYSITRNANISASYTFNGSTNSGQNKIDDWTYDFTTKLCTITARNAPVTVNYSTWIYSLAMVQKFLKEIQV
jgi:hypothetical protein